MPTRSSLILTKSTLIDIINFNGDKINVNIDKINFKIDKINFNIDKINFNINNIDSIGIGDFSKVINVITIVDFFSTADVKSTAIMNSVITFSINNISNSTE